MSKLTSFGIFISLSITLLSSQSQLPISPGDNQWYIWNSNYIAGCTASQSNGRSCTWASSDNTTNNFCINNVSSPSSPNNGRTPRNDIFFITSNNHFYNSRHSSSLPNLNQNSQGYLINNNPNIGTIKYLYYTNVYDEDDSNPNISKDCSNFTQVNIPVSAYNNPNSIQGNHDIMLGADYTLIIPESIVEGIFNTYPKFRIEFHPVLNNPILLTKNENSNLYLFEYSSSTNPRLLTISKNNNYAPSNNYNTFINFNSVNDAQFLGQQAYIKFFGVDTQGKSNSLYTHYEDIGLSHDPNAQELLCISKANNNRYKLNYNIYFNNVSPDAGVDKTIIKFNLPEGFQPGSLFINNWKYGAVEGNKTGCKMKYKFSRNNTIVELEFDNNGRCQDLEGLSSYNSSTHTDKGYVNFCFERTHNDQIVLNSTFKLSDLKIKFDNNDWQYVLKYEEPIYTKSPTDKEPTIGLSGNCENCRTRVNSCSIIERLALWWRCIFG